MKLNCGAGEPFSHTAWLDVDIRPSTRPDVVADLRALPFAAGAAEMVYAGHVLEHLPLGDVVQVLRELHRVLAPGGPLLAVGPDVEKSIPMHAAGLITDERLASNRCHGEPGNVCVHQWDCSGREVAWMLRKAGFRAVHEIPIAESPTAFPVFDRVSADQFAVTAQR